MPVAVFKQRVVAIVLFGPYPPPESLSTFGEKMIGCQQKNPRSDDRGLVLAH